MATYASLDILTDLYGEDDLIMLTGGDGQVKQEPLERAMRIADTEINAYLQGVTQLPLDVVPESLELQASKIAYFYLHRDHPTDGAKDAYKSALSFMKRVQDGKAGLGLSEDGDRPAQDDSVRADPADSNRPFSQSKIDQYG